MEIQTIITIITSIVTGASIILKVVAPLTKTKKDDKVLAFLQKILKLLSLNVKETDKVEISIKNK